MVWGMKKEDLNVTRTEGGSSKRQNSHSIVGKKKKKSGRTVEPDTEGRKKKSNQRLPASKVNLWKFRSEGTHCHPSWKGLHRREFTKKIGRRRRKKEEGVKVGGEASMRLGGKE